MIIESQYKSPAQIDYLIKDLKNNNNFIEIKNKALSQKMHMETIGSGAAIPMETLVQFN